MNIETIQTVTVVVPCSYTGEYRFNVPLDSEGFPMIPELSEADYGALTTGITPVERAHIDTFDWSLVPGTGARLDPGAIVRQEEGGRDQAIDAFIQERSELKDHIVHLGDALDFFGGYCDAMVDQRDILAKEVRNVSDKVQRQRGALNGQSRQMAQANDVLIQAARYMERTRELLAQMGVKIETDEKGYPSLSVNVDMLKNFPAPALLN